MPRTFRSRAFVIWSDRKSTRLNSSHTVIYTLSLHDALPISQNRLCYTPVFGLDAFPSLDFADAAHIQISGIRDMVRSEERRVGKECRSLCDWSSDVCSSDLAKPFVLHAGFWFRRVSFAGFRGCRAHSDLGHS